MEFFLAEISDDFKRFKDGSSVVLSVYVFEKKLTFGFPRQKRFSERKLIFTRY